MLKYNFSKLTLIPVDAKITIATTKVITNAPAPKIDPITIGTPSIEFPALKEEITSGDPFAKANKVTPARVSEIVRFFAIFDRAGER